MAKGDDLQERFINFAVGIIKVCGQLPNTPAGKHVGSQLLRSGTSPAFIMVKRVVLRVATIFLTYSELF
jgi:hypothetical protein